MEQIKKEPAGERLVLFPIDFFPVSLPKLRFAAAEDKEFARSFHR